MSPELIEASTGVTRWARPFDAAFTDVFAVQAEHRGPGRGRAAPGAHRLRPGAAQRGAHPSLDAYARYLRSRELRSGEIHARGAPRGHRRAGRGGAARHGVRRRAGPSWPRRRWTRSGRAGSWCRTRTRRARRFAARAALAPDSPDVRAASARYQLGVEGDFTAALRDYREALRAAPHRSDLLIGAGTVEMELNRWPEAVADLEHAARLDPRSPDAACWVGSAYLRLRRYDEARRELDRARGLRPASMSLGYSRARLAAAQGDLPGIRRVFKELERSAGPRAVAAYVALREDLIWALEDDQLRIVTTLTPDDLDGGRADWALAVSEAHRFLGDSARSRAYADSAVTAYDAMLERLGQSARPGADRGDTGAGTGPGRACARGPGDGRRGRTAAAARLGHPEPVHRLRAEPHRRDGR